MNRSGQLLLGLLGIFLILFLGSCATAEVRAVRSGDINALREYISGGGDPDTRQKDGQTLLMIAAESSQVESASYLLDSGATVDARDNRGLTALMYASNAGSVPIAEILISRGAQVNTQDSSGSHALYIASGKGNLQLVQLLLDAGADPGLKNNSGLSAIFAAVANNRTAVAERLLQEGADPSAEDSSGLPLLFYSLKKGRADMVSLLLNSGASADKTDNNGRTPLIAAAEEDAGKIVSLLLNAAPREIDSIDNDGWNAVLRALNRSAEKSNGLTESAEILINNGAYIDPENILTINIAYKAVKNRNREVIRILLNAGFDPNPASPGGEQLIVLAIADIPILQDLIASGAAVDAADRNGRTALFEAVKQGNGEAARILLQNGASVNITAPDGRNILMYIAAGDDVVLARQMIMRGIPVNQRDKQRRTALHYAAETGSPEMLRLLLTAGADFNAIDSNGNQSIDVAARNPRKEEIIQILLTAGARFRPETGVTQTVTGGSVPGNTVPGQTEIVTEREIVPAGGGITTGVKNDTDETVPSGGAVPGGNMQGETSVTAGGLTGPKTSDAGTSQVVGGGNGTDSGIGNGTNNDTGDTAQQGTEESETSADETYVYPANKRSSPSNKQVTLSVINSSNMRVELIWVDTEGIPVSIGMLNPGQTTDHPTMAAYYFIIRNSGGDDIFEYKTTGSRTQTWDFNAESSNNGKGNN